MAKIYRLSDRIEVRIDGVTVKLAPLDFHTKTEVQDLLVKGQLHKDVKSLTQGMMKLLQVSIKDVSGIETVDGQPYSLKFENNVLSEETLNDLLNTEFSEKLQAVCTALLKGVPDKLDLEGVELIKSKKDESRPN